MSTTATTPVPSENGSLRREKVLDVEQPAISEASDKATTAAPEPISPFHPSQFPDGGRDAWLCLLGGACCLFCSFGWLNCVGVFQSYYSQNQLRDYNSSQIAWIASLEICKSRSKQDRPRSCILIQSSHDVSTWSSRGVSI